MVEKILIIVDSIDVDDSSGSKANVALIHNIRAVGYNVTVFHYSRKEIHIKNINCYAIPEKKWTPLYFLSRAQRVFTRLTDIKIHSLFENIFGFSFTFFNDVQSIKSALLEKNDFTPDLIITLSKGASFRTHYAVLKLPELHNKWLAYVHDPYPFHYYPKPYDWIEPGYKIKEIFFKGVSEKATFSGFPSQLLMEWMGNYFPNFLETGVVIPHQNADVKIESVDVSGYFDASKFNLLHAGNLMKQRNPKGLIEGFKLFLRNNPEAKQNARLFLIGSADYHEKMLNDFQKGIPELFICLENKPFNEVQFLQRSTSVNIILESKSEISPFLPGKFPHCVAADKPILALGPHNSEIKRLLGNDYTYWADVESIAKIAEIIHNLYSLWLEKPETFKLDRPDLEYYCSVFYLQKVIKGIKI